MLIKESFEDVKTSGGTSMRVFLFEPSIRNYPNAKFPGVVIFSEIYQVTGPVARFARQICSQGYLCAAPSSYHDFGGPEAFPYDEAGTDLGNSYKVEKTVESYDEDALICVDLLLSKKNSNGNIGSTGMCLGGHLALRCALDSRVSASVCFFPTDIHSSTLGKGRNDDTISAMKTIRGEVVLIFGKNDNHVSPEGRDLIRKTLHDAGVEFTFLEISGAAHAFIRDESSKGRYDAATTKFCFELLLEVFNRRLKLDLGNFEDQEHVVKDVC
ncbi:hypothetical protein TWF694_003911 [Orbilia ellipsospora]|uniref:Dienelactone hydrolase domain-containing protein n=1 Tax=Orbilia ellipsospora TaxID=2528407 RepID=A0AAV9WWR3_9PEZI